MIIFFFLFTNFVNLFSQLTAVVKTGHIPGGKLKRQRKEGNDTVTSASKKAKETWAPAKGNNKSKKERKKKKEKGKECYEPLHPPPIETTLL